MSTHKIIKTRTGWTTVETKQHKVKIVKPIMTVENWIKAIVRLTEKRPKDLGCERCGLKWVEANPESFINICMMDKEINTAICDTCYSELSNTLVTKIKKDNHEKDI